jgi:hypothetical protein
MFCFRRLSGDSCLLENLFVVQPRKDTGTTPLKAQVKKA